MFLPVTFDGCKTNWKENFKDVFINRSAEWWLNSVSLSCTWGGRINLKIKIQMLSDLLKSDVTQGGWSHRCSHAEPMCEHPREQQTGLQTCPHMKVLARTATESIETCNAEIKLKELFSQVEFFVNRPLYQLGSACSGMICSENYYNSRGNGSFGHWNHTDLRTLVLC